MSWRSGRLKWRDSLTHTQNHFLVVQYPIMFTPVKKIGPVCCARTPNPCEVDVVILDIIISLSIQTKSRVELFKPRVLTEFYECLQIVGKVLHKLGIEKLILYWIPDHRRHERPSSTHVARG